MEIPSLIQILIAIALFILVYSTIEELFLTGFEASKYLSRKVFTISLVIFVLVFAVYVASIMEDSGDGFFIGAIIGWFIFIFFLGLLAKLNIIKS